MGVSNTEGRGRGSPLRLLAELSLPDIVDGTEAELVGAGGDQAVDGHCGRLGLDAGQQDRPGSVWNTEKRVLVSHLVAPRAR